MIGSSKVVERQSKDSLAWHPGNRKSGLESSRLPLHQNSRAVMVPPPISPGISRVGSAASLKRRSSGVLPLPNTRWLLLEWVVAGEVQGAARMALHREVFERSCSAQCCDAPSPGKTSHTAVRALLEHTIIGGAACLLPGRYKSRSRDLSPGSDSPTCDPSHMSTLACNGERAV
jgi:hypothetical protein